MYKKWMNNCIAAGLVLLLACGLTGCSDSADGSALSADDSTTIAAGNTSAGMSLLESGNYAEAVTTLTTEAQEQSGREREETLRELGIAYMGLGDYENAATVLEEALTYAGVIPSDEEYDINYYLGSCYYKLERYEDALSVYDAIVTLRPRDPEAYVLRGTVRMTLSDTEGMKEDYAKAIDLDPTDYDRIVEIYEAMDRGGYTDDGKAYLQQTLDDYGSKMDNYNRGRINYYLGNYNDAKTALEQIETRDYDTAILLGKTYEALGDMNFASSVYQTYLASDSTHPEVYNQLGLCCLAMKDYDAALTAFQQGESLGDSEALQSLQFNEIIAYEYLGDFTKAQVLMKEYLNKYPGDTAAQREYTFLSTR